LFYEKNLDCNSACLTFFHFLDLDWVVPSFYIYIWSEVSCWSVWIDCDRAANLMDIIRYLRADDKECRTFMQQLCQWSLMGNHLVPLLLHYWKRDNLVDWNLNLLIGEFCSVLFCSLIFHRVVKLILCLFCFGLFGLDTVKCMTLLTMPVVPGSRNIPHQILALQKCKHEILEKRSVFTVFMNLAAECLAKEQRYTLTIYLLYNNIYINYIRSTTYTHPRTSSSKNK
jgi:hypothetical protein